MKSQNLRFEIRDLKLIVTARQLEDQIKSSGQVKLPRAARLTPLAADWIKAKRVKVQYDDAPVAATPTAATSAPAGTTLWWCDGPCGAAKGAIMTLSREIGLAELPVPQDAKQIVRAIKHLAAEIMAGRATAGVLVVKTGAPAVVFSNRCPSIRAVLGTCLDAVEQGVRQVAANVLIVEHPYQTMSQMRNMVSRFAKAKRELTDEVKKQLQELSSCG
jgi:ribose 5-phosphate isomerase RpiB